VRNYRALDEKNSYTNLATAIAHYSRALGHPARIALLVEIAKKGGKVKGEALDLPMMSQATVLQHLRELKRAGLIQGRIFGARSEFKIDQQKLNEYAGQLESFLDHFNEL
jgi:DNA-binding transcriptional ArsR family regulator